MATAVNVSGSNPGPNSGLLPDTVQSPVGNLWKVGTFALVISPAIVATVSAPTQVFTATGIGLLVGDVVVVTPPSITAGVGMLSAWVAAADALSIQFVNPTAGGLTPPAGTAAAPYLVSVFRKQPLWTAPATGSQLDW